MAHRDRFPFPHLPAAQLHAALARLDSPDDPVHVRAGVTRRTVNEWESGLRQSCKFDIADRVLLNMGWLWWEVWTEENTSPDQLELVEFAFTGEWPGQSSMGVAA